MATVVFLRYAFFNSSIKNVTETFNSFFYQIYTDIMLITSLFLVPIFLYLLVASFKEDRSRQSSTPASATPIREYREPYREPSRYHDPYYGNQRSPLFSPDKRYIWDGDRWVPNNGGFGGGLLLGIIIAGVLVVLAMKFF